MKWFAFALAAAVSIAPAFADDSTPVGLWKNIDDVTGKPKALIRISENNGVLQGKIEQLFRAPTEDQNPKCEKCERTQEPAHHRHGIHVRPEKGWRHLHGRRNFDPDNGKVYKSKMHLSDNGKKLNVRGYIGVPMLGRSQVWVRQE
jgi:uncharacterized protein (DUF2147 family)